MPLPLPRPVVGQDAGKPMPDGGRSLWEGVAGLRGRLGGSRKQEPIDEPEGELRPGTAGLQEAEGDGLPLAQPRGTDEYEDSPSTRRITAASSSTWLYPSGVTIPVRGHKRQNAGS